MKIFLTGATGYIGSAIAGELLAHGYSVVGLARSAQAAAKLLAAGVTPVRGDLTDGPLILSTSEGADGVIHAGSPGDATSAQMDESALACIIDGLRGSGRPLIYTSGIWLLGATGMQEVDETAPLNPIPLVAWRAVTECYALDSASAGIRAVSIRPGIVYGRGGGIPAMLRPEPDGIVRLVGDGENFWPVVHVDDLAQLYRKALERAHPATVFHGVTDNVRVREAAEAMREGSGATEVRPTSLDEARSRLGPVADALALDQHVSGQLAVETLDWRPNALPLLEDLRRGSYLLAVEAPMG